MTEKIANNSILLNTVKKIKSELHFTIFIKYR